MEINGVPLHPLVVHAAVVFVPLAALAVIAFLVPRWRWAARWPAVVLVVGATAAVQLSTLTGETLEETRGPRSAVIELHQEYADLLQVAMYALAVVMIVAFVTMPHAHPSDRRAGPRGQGGRPREAVDGGARAPGRDGDRPGRADRRRRCTVGLAGLTQGVGVPTVEMRRVGALRA